VEVVAVLQKALSEGVAAPAPVPERIRLALWVLALLDVMTVAWMLSAGEWLDRTSSVTAVITLGGHHVVVLGLALAGFVMLAALTLLTGAFTATRRWHLPLIALGALLSAVAVGGIASMMLLAVLGVVLVSVVGYAFIGGRLVFLGGLFRRR
jgi:hypothetical protein